MKIELKLKLYWARHFGRQKVVLYTLMHCGAQRKTQNAEYHSQDGPGLEWKTSIERRCPCDATAKRDVEDEIDTIEARNLTMRLMIHETISRLYLY
jgi:hypothetical protein